MKPPQRLQRSRVKGSKLPAGTICVTRPLKYSNPYVIGEPIPLPAGVTPLASREPRTVEDLANLRPDLTVLDAAHAVALFRAYLEANPDILEQARRDLAGRDLACWCGPDLPCHADVLIELVNPWHAHDMGCCFACYSGKATHFGEWTDACRRFPYGCQEQDTMASAPYSSGDPRG